jgi:hypothetical protein
MTALLPLILSLFASLPFSPANSTSDASASGFLIWEMNMHRQNTFNLQPRSGRSLARRTRWSNAVVQATSPSRWFEALERRSHLSASSDLADDVLGLEGGSSSVLDLEHTPDQPSAPAPAVGSSEAPQGPAGVEPGSPASNAMPAGDPEAPPTAAPTRSRADFRFNLRPGTGFSGATIQPPAVGNPGDFGYDAKAIARWDVVPFQTFTGRFDIGVVAFHINGIDRVDFAVNGGDWTSVRNMTFNRQTNVNEYTITLNAADFADGQIEIRAIAWPTVGEPRVLAGEISASTINTGNHSLHLSTNSNATLNRTQVFASPLGNDASGNGSAEAPFRTIFRATQLLQSLGKADGGEVLLAAGAYEWSRPNGTAVAVTTDRWLTVRPMDGVSRDDVRITQPAGAQNNGLSTRLVHLKNVTIAASLETNSPQVDFLWLDGVHVNGQGPLDQRIYWSQSWWTGIFATDSLATSVVNGFPVTLARNCVVDTLHADAFPGTLAVINSVVRNQVIGIDPHGYPYHSDFWQERQGITGQNVIVYGNTATENCLGQGFFTRGSPHQGIAFVDNVLYLRGYPNQSQFISLIDHMVFANNSLLGTPVNIGLTDPNQSVVGYAGSRNVRFENNVFQWMSLSDPRNTLPRPLGLSSFGEGTQFLNNHFVNLWPSYTGSSGTPHGAVVLGTGATTGPGIPPGRGPARAASVAP